MEITREEPAPADLPPRAVTLQDVKDYLAAAGEDERGTIRADLMPDTCEAGLQARLTPARRSFSTQTPAPAFSMSQNPDGSVTLEHPSIHIWILDSLIQRD